MSCGLISYIVSDVSESTSVLSTPILLSGGISLSVGGTWFRFTECFGILTGILSIRIASEDVNLTVIRIILERFGDSAD